MQCITEMNEEAATLIENGRYESALEVLDFAMETLHAVAADEHDENYESDSESSIASETTCRSQQSISSSSPCTSSSTSSGPQGHRPLSPRVSTTKHFNGDFVYTFPMRFADTREQEDDDEDEHQELDTMNMGVILLFNMGLSHHLKALMIPNDTNKANVALKCALKMYQLAFCLLLQGGVQLSVTQVLALTNNCGQIYKHLKRASKAKSFFTHMLSTLITMIEGGSADDVEHLDGFMWNASRVVLQDPAVASAA